MTKPNFIARYTAWRKENKRIAVGGLILFFAIFFASSPLAWWMDAHKPKFWVQVAYGGAIFGYFLGGILLLVWCDRRQTRKFGLLCPSCGKSLAGPPGHNALESGSCGRCGAAIFAEADAKGSDAKGSDTMPERS